MLPLFQAHPTAGPASLNATVKRLSPTAHYSLKKFKCEETGEQVAKYICNYCQKPYSGKGSTDKIARHVAKSHPEAFDVDGTKKKISKQTVLSTEGIVATNAEFNRNLAVVFARLNQPPSHVDRVCTRVCVQR